MSVISPARTQPTVIHLDRLPAHIEDQFEDLMAQADQAAEHRELTAYALLHAQAVTLLGIRTPISGELARCTCTNCYCAAVFDAQYARTSMDGTTEIVQCETCADEHRLTGDE